MKRQIMVVRKLDRIPLRQKSVIVSAFAMMAAALVAEAKPVTWWASHPVKPGEHVLVSGGGWTGNVKVRFEGRLMDPTSVSDTGVTFRWPEDMDVLRPSVALEDETGSSEPIVLNAPTVWWMQGDDFDASAPGGEVRLFGRSLDVGKVTLVSSDGREHELSASARDAWSCTAAVPCDVPEGEYSVKVDGIEQKCRWRIHVPDPIYGTNVFRVVDFGAVPDDAIDDDAAVQAALTAARKAKGGIVLFPRGRIDVHSTLDIPPRTLLKGVSRDVSGIFWPDFYNPPPVLVKGPHSFGMEDLFLTCGRFAVGIKPAVNGHDFTFRRLRIRFITDLWRDDGDLASFGRRYDMPGTPFSVFRCRRVRVEDVDFVSDKNGTGNTKPVVCQRVQMVAVDAVVKDSSFRGSGYDCFVLDRATVERCEFADGVMSVRPGARRNYWSDNLFRDHYAGDREGLTQDLRLNAYGDLLPSGRVDGVKVSFDVPANTPITFRSGSRNPRYNDFAEWLGADIQIVRGRGIGQIRRIMKVVSKTEFEIDSPFGLAPDATSRFSVRVARRHVHYVGNEFRDAHVAVQLYGGAQDFVIAGNRSLLSGGFIGHGVDGKGGIMPVTECQFLDNEILSSLETYRMRFIPACVGCPRPQRPWMTRGLVLRGNVIEGGALALGCRDGIAEGNTVRNSAVGLLQEPEYARTHVVAGNTFENVTTRCSGTWPLPKEVHVTGLVWDQTAPDSDVVTLESVLTVTGDAPASVRMWCPARKASLHLDGAVAFDAGTDRRIQMTYTLAPGRHGLRVALPVKAATSALRKNPLVIVPLGDAVNRIK